MIVSSSVRFGSLFRSSSFWESFTNLHRLVNSVIGQERQVPISWASDIHIDHADETSFSRFIAEIKAQNPSMLLLTGDIDMGKANPVDEGTGRRFQANGFVETIRKIQSQVAIPVFFILGNHDFYFSSFEEVRADAEKLSTESENVHYIHNTPGIEIDKETALVGHNGWADSRAGDFWHSELALNDFFLISDFGVKRANEIRTTRVKEMLEHLGEVSADYAKELLPALFKRYKQVIFLTHVPPFLEASWHEGHISDPESAPFFVNQALGDTLREIMQAHPRKKLLLLCGHTHSESIYQPLDNLTVWTAGAEYGSPVPQKSITLD